MNLIYFNQKLLPADAFPLNVNDRGLLLGDGIFATIRVCSGKVLFLTEHWQRLTQNAQIINLILPLTLDELKTQIETLLQANQLQQSDAALRLTVTRGIGPRGLLPAEKSEPTVILTAQPYLPMQKSALTAKIIRHHRNEFSPLSLIKSLNYLDNILAKQAAIQAGADEAILLNTQGNLACASAANIFLVRNKKIITPDLQQGAVPGIMRQQLIKLAAEEKIEIETTVVPADILFQAEEIFITNSLLGIMPIIQVDNKLVNESEVGAVTLKLDHALQVFIANALLRHCERREAI